jgi:hypothetical protein
MMFPVPINWRVICLVAVALLVAGAGFWLGWKLNGYNVRTAQVALSDQQAKYRTLEAQGKADALQRIKDSLAKAQEKDREYQDQVAKLRADADVALHRAHVRFLRCKADAAVPPGGTGQAGDPGQPAGAPTDGSGMGADIRVDLDRRDAALVEAKIISARLRGLQAVCAPVQAQ